ncbi:ATP phosphoribosyltransferase [Treponema sp. R6D11]
MIIGLPKGRIAKGAYELLKQKDPEQFTSLELEAELENQTGKKLCFKTDKTVFLLLKAKDVPLYADSGMIDVGICGFDCFREYELASKNTYGSMSGNNYTTTLTSDLQLQDAIICVAGKGCSSFENYTQAKQENGILTIATQYPGIAKNFFDKKGIEVDIKPINGSAEIAPEFLGVDAIVDIVESGDALRTNGLVIYEDICENTTKILVNKTSLRLDPTINELMKSIEGNVREKLCSAPEKKFNRPYLTRRDIPLKARKGLIL